MSSPDVTALASSAAAFPLPGKPEITTKVAHFAKLVPR